MHWSVVALIAGMVGVCIGCGLMAVLVAGGREDAYEAGFRDGTDWADLEDTRNG